MIQDKAQFAVNGCSLNKNCNAVLSYLWVSLLVALKAPSSTMQYTRSLSDLT